MRQGKKYRKSSAPKWLESRYLMIAMGAWSSVFLISLPFVAYYYFTRGANEILYYQITQSRVPGVVVAINVCILIVLSIVCFAFALPTLHKVNKERKKRSEIHNGETRD